MSALRSAHIILVLICQCFFLTNASFAHPASGIVVDAQGRVYFIYSGHGVMRIEPSGRLTSIHEDKGGHWLALDTGGAFSKVAPKQFERITPDGAVPALIFASGGAPPVAFKTKRGAQMHDHRHGANPAMPTKETGRTRRSESPKPHARAIVEPQPSSWLLPFRYFQPFATPDPLHSILAHLPASMLQQRRDAAVAVTAILAG
jgi:hypothetical protein